MSYSVHDAEDNNDEIYHRGHSDTDRQPCGSKTARFQLAENVG